MPGPYGFVTRHGHRDGSPQVFRAPIDVLTTAEQTPVALPFQVGDVILRFKLIIYVAEATAATKTALLGFNAAAGVDDDPDGLAVAISTAAKGVLTGLLLGTDTLGALLKEDTNGSTVLVRKPYVITQADTVFTYTLASAHTELVADIEITFERPVYQIP